MRTSAIVARSAFILGALVLLLLSGTPGLALAKSAALPALPHAGQITVHLEPPILSAYPQVSAYMSVIGADGQPVINLNQSDVTVTIDGKAVQLQQLSSVINVGESITASILFDTSGSMLGEKLADAKSAIISFGQNLGDQDQVALYQVAGSAGGVKKILDFTKDHAKLADAVNPLQANGETPIYDAVYQAAQDLSAVQGRKLIILQTDGEDTTSQHSIDEAIALAQQLHLPVYTIGLGLGTDQKARDALQKISSETGGAFFDAPQPSQLTATYQQILTQLRQSYLLTVSSPVQVDTQEHTLAVNVQYQGNTYSDSTTFTIKAVPPQISTSLRQNQQLVGSADFTVNVLSSATPIRAVTVEIDGKPFDTAKGTPPYHFSWNIRFV
jgi:Ca-activated chloride channel family protein